MVSFEGAQLLLLIFAFLPVLVFYRQDIALFLIAQGLFGQDPRTGFRH